jgi:fatty acid desaturase
LAITVTDPVYIEENNISAFESLILKVLNDRRDMPFIYLSLKITFIVLPAAIFLFLNKDLNLLFYISYFLLFMYFLGPYVLMLHNTCHRKLFKKKYSYLTKYTHWFLGLFFGQTPETYFHHHIAMHHPENNLDSDLSSTMKYQRDSLRAFLKYLILFYIVGVLELCSYFKKRGRKRFALKILAGEIFSIALIILLSSYNLKAALTVLVAPIMFTRFAMMAGNWAQHAFIDPIAPANIYRNSITCINTSYNKKCFNDGYHIGHHLRPALHWTEMPKDFVQNIEKYKQNDVIIFTGLDYFQIWFLLMIKNYKYLSKKFVSLPGTSVPPDGIEALLRGRTRKFASSSC